MAEEDGGQQAEGEEEGTRDHVAPAEVCHFLQLGPTSQFPKMSPNSATTWEPNVQHMGFQGTFGI